ncbi:MAG TPA: M48 family metalloprotease [Magnetospirillum sp.]|nr:M48 family metalloprotease [Magnetospirillum sp.]
MPITRRTLLAGLGASAVTPAWAQAIRSQNDPWAQVDPYDDPRNGFPAEGEWGGGNAPVHRNALAGNGSKALLSAEEQNEVAAGRMAYPYRIKKLGGACSDPKLQQAIRDFCRPMFAVADRANLPWVVTLVNERKENASAGPGGTVIVHAGIVAIFDSPYELASVLGHEVGHVDCRHLSRGKDIGMLADIVRQQGITGMGDEAMTRLMPQVEGRVLDFMDLMEKKFSREDEEEADIHAIEIFDRLGIDPILAASGMRKIMKLEQMSGGAAPNEWVTNHPLTPDRVVNIERAAALRRKPATNFTFPGWDVLKAAFPTPPEFKKT